MDAAALALVLVGLLVGLVLGVLLGWLWQQARTATERAELRARAEAAESSHERVTGELGRSGGLEAAVGPLQSTLDKVEARLGDLERTRAASAAALREQVEGVRASGEALRRETGALVSALRRPQVRGRWGEMHLKRAVELAGMVEHCDFDVQVVLPEADSAATGVRGALRPDLVVHLAGGKQVVVDAKVPLDAFLSASELDGADPAGAVSAEAVEEERGAHLRAHARQLRVHVDQLGGKAYWRAVGGSPEFVVLFVPGESFLAAALEVDPSLLEHAAARRVVIATPTTLIALLRTVSYAWTQDALTSSAREVFDLGRELYTRLAGLGEHLDRLGRQLGGSVTAYNKAVGSLERRVLVTARRLRDTGLTIDDLPAPAPVDELPRPLTAPELLDGVTGDGDEVGVGTDAPVRHLRVSGRPGGSSE